MSDPFNDPSTGGDQLPLKELLGSLLLFDVKEACAEMQTSFGPATPIRADVAVLDGTHKGDTYTDALVFPRVLQGQLRNSVGAKVLGRLGQGEAKKGQSPPWTLTASTDADKEVGRRYLAFAASQVAVGSEPF